MTLDDLLDEESHPYKLWLLAIAKAVWPGAGSLPAHEGGRYLGYVEDVLGGHGTPTLSQADRDAITAAAARIGDAP